MPRLSTAAVAVALASCGGTSASPTSTYPVNQCISHNASYVAVYSETSGNCGPLSNAVFNVSASGTTTGVLPENPSCASGSGCVVQDNGCVTVSTTGFTWTTTGQVTWAADGSGGTGTISIGISGDGQSCYSTYTLEYTRQ